ncbi:MULTISPECIES: aspartate:alanine exchanger family transporter [Bradyrhizobium]|uniref:aspartate:alanine exchanger family transporter n=1 Tax=Bradyrhizobium TaxID=374 RepID=UPI00155E4E2A|nr:MULTISPECIES: transporter [Bradyrhizobium]MDD1518822.1 transporter [Bradyrhizobium sp. WBAH30]MDD1541180.1 transporter [Bradyrhizobium sp. WBAH41]MDD1557196.1 transporter [Bradyrhizobium sp. WBAH23]MDD1563815.1 transporter [Bradyrhizobium sp. WBAH33]MDD1590016.1 transporter [Bradyrhizobium sp. WBAH42]
MQAFFEFLRQYPYLLLFFVVGLAVYIGRASIKGYGLGMVAGAIVVGAGLSVWASSYGVKLELNNFAKSLFYYLFMYGVGLRVGPSFVNSLRGDGIKFLFLAVVSSVIGLALVVIGAKLFALPPGAAGGMLAGSQTMSAAIGSAEQAVTSGVVKLPAGMKPEDASGMIALSYGITYIWGTVGIILICKYLPRWWGVDAKAAAKQYEQEFGVKDLEGGALTGYRQFGLRAYRLENPATVGMSIAKFRAVNPEYRIVNVGRNGEPQGADPELVLQKGDIVALGGSTEHLTEKMGLIGPEVADAKTLGIPMDQAEIVVFNKDVVGRTFESFRDTAIAGQLQVTKVERGGVQIPAGLKTKLERMDIVSVVGLKSAVNELGEMWGRIARANTSTDLLTLSVGMIIGFLIGMIEFPAFGAKVGLGNAGGLLLSGVIVSSVVSRLRFFGNTPNAARNVLEDLGLVVFVAIVGVNAGAGLLAQLTGALALKIFIVGFIACTIPPFIVWAIGFHVFKINPAVLMGGVAGARSHSGPCREAAVEIQSSVPWIGFPVGYAVSGILLTIFGYFAMILAQ